MIRIAFPLINDEVWAGGYNYLFNLFKVISLDKNNYIKPVIFHGDEINKKKIADLKKIKQIELVETSLMNSSNKKKILFNSFVFGKDTKIEALFLSYKIDIIFENAFFYGKDIKIPIIAWIPDFQHRLLPEMFSLLPWIKREIGFRAQISSGRRILLSSKDSIKYCKKFYPKSKKRINLVRFSVIPPRILKDSTTIKIKKYMNFLKKKYSLPKKYIFLPNQFWEHKNHLIVLEALNILKKKGYNVKIISSGKQIDPSKPNYFNKIKKKIIKYQLQDQFLMLGLIPYEHVIMLMLGSISVLNPSLCEGRSTTVEECKALNIKMILSNIDIHKEQARNKAIFFNPNNKYSLVRKIYETFEKRQKKLINKNFFLINTKEIKTFQNDINRLVRDTIGLKRDLPIEKYSYNKKISFIMVACNAAKFIKEAIQSIQIEKKVDWELVIVDDFSKDQTFKIIKDIAKKDTRVKVFRNLIKGKVSGTNYGYSKTNGQIIKCIDSDDVLEKDFFDYYDMLATKQVHCHNAFITDSRLNIKTIYNINPLFIKEDYKFVLKYLLSFPKWSWSFSREIADKIFPMPENLPFEDVWIALVIKKYSKNIFFIKQPLYRYRQHAEQTYGGIINYNNEIVIFRSKRILKLIDILSNNKIIMSNYKKQIFNKIKNYYYLLSKENLRLDDFIKLKVNFNSSVKVILIKFLPTFVKYLTIIKWKIDAFKKI